MNVCFPLICLEEVAPICETVAQSNQNCFAFSLLFSLVAAPVCLPLRSTAFISFTSVSMVLKLTGSISVLQNQIQNCLSKPAAPHERSLSLPLQLRNTFWRPTTKRLWVSLMHYGCYFSHAVALPVDLLLADTLFFADDEVLEAAESEGLSAALSATVEYANRTRSASANISRF